MATKTIVELLDDTDETETLIADSTVLFGLDGQSFEIDLADHNARALREALDKYIRKARVVAGAPRAYKATQGRPKATSGPKPAVIGGVDPTALRAWAETDQGKAQIVNAGLTPPSARGRVSKALIDLYENRTRVHKDPAPATAVTETKEEEPVEEPVLTRAQKAAASRAAKKAAAAAMAEE